MHLTVGPSNPQLELELHELLAWPHHPGSNTSPHAT
jgi:hypothetical protein